MSVFHYAWNFVQRGDRKLLSRNVLTITKTVGIYGNLDAFIVLSILRYSCPCYIGHTSSRILLICYRLYSIIDLKADLKGNSTVKTSWAQIKDNTINKFFPKYLGPNHFSKGEIVRQSSRICQISTPCCSFPCRRESGQRSDLWRHCVLRHLLFSYC